VIAFLVNGAAGSAMADRAQAFASRLPQQWQPVVFCRTGSRARSAAHFAEALRRTRPDLVYVLDMGLAGVVAAAGHRVLGGARFIVDTGDVVTALARKDARRGAMALVATAAVERLGTALAAHVVVRGTAHHEMLREQGYASTVIPDGVDLSVFQPGDGTRARQRLGFGEDVVVTVLGSSVWNPRLRMAYGWDLVEALGLLKELPLRGLVIGDGSGIPEIARRARELGVEDRLVFVGRQPLASLPPLLCASDVCLSTQTNDVVGQVRTTGKLPLYLACGRYVLASAVGEAARVLPPDMLIEYRGGGRDDSYPERLAARLRKLTNDRRRLAVADQAASIAREHFDYDRLAARVHSLCVRYGRRTGRAHDPADGVSA
jgi:glycosyltransferase involved in cell wall biosynthesis